MATTSGSVMSPSKQHGTDRNLHEHGSLRGRDRELALLDLALGRPDDGLRIALLRGGSGIGKSALAQAATLRSADRGFDVVVLEGRDCAHATPLAALADAIPEFGSALAAAGSLDADRIGAALYTALAGRTSRTPVLLVVDDAHALDASSLAALACVDAGGEELQLSLLLVEQTDAVGVGEAFHDFVRERRARNPVAVVEPGPLAADDVRAIVAAELDTDLERVPAAIVDRAGGNPWFARELARGWSTGAMQVPGCIVDAARRRLDVLDAPSRALVDAIALCDDGASAAWLRGLADVGDDASFEAACRRIRASGLVRTDQDWYSIAHPLVQQIVVEALPAVLRRAVHLELAAAIAATRYDTVPHQRARALHLGAAGRQVDAVDLLLHAADANERAGRLQDAYVDLARALDHELQAERRPLLLRRTAALAMQFDTTRARRYWTELARSAAQRGDDEAYAEALFHQYWTSSDGAQLDRLVRAAQLGSDRIGWSALAAANMASLESDYATSAQHNATAVRIARTTGDSALETMATQRHGAALGLLGRHEESIDVLRQAVQLAVVHAQHVWVVAAMCDLADEYISQLRGDEAVDILREATDYIEGHGMYRMRPRVLALMALELLHRGDLRAAHDTIESIGANGGLPVAAKDVPLVALIRAEIRCEAGNGFELAIREAIPHIEKFAASSWREQLRIAQARAAARTSMDCALEHVRELDWTGEPDMLAEAALWLLRASVVRGWSPGIDHCRTMLAELPAAGAGRYVDLARRELTNVLAALQDGDASPLETIADEWATAGRVLDALRVLAVAGVLELAAGRTDEGTCKLREARVGLAERGAGTDVDLVAAILRSTGAGSRARTAASDVGGLTARELEVARLVATGLRNADVAGRLQVTRRTVTEHLTNIYAKVGVTSRVQLAAWMSEHDRERTQVVAHAASFCISARPADPRIATVA